MKLKCHHPSGHTHWFYLSATGIFTVVTAKDEMYLLAQNSLEWRSLAPALPCQRRKFLRRWSLPHLTTRIIRPLPKRSRSLLCKQSCSIFICFRTCGCALPGYPHCNDKFSVTAHTHHQERRVCKCSTIFCLLCCSSCYCRRGRGGGSGRTGIATVVLAIKVQRII
jgi:hypothetical protein